MQTAAENEDLTRVGPGTPMGELMRRYWHPIAAVTELRDEYTIPVKLLGERLVLFRDRAGNVGLVDELCPHRRASLAYGIPDVDGIRCPYHGWKFNAQGRCIDQPNEPRGSAFKEKIRTKAYPVQELGGMYFAYLGPAPAPLLPRFDGFVIEPAIRMVGRAVIPVNWLQIMENSLDPVHTEWLHGHMFEYLGEKTGVKTPISRHHERIAFDEFPYGIIKRRLLTGQSEDCDDWQIGHPVIFPTMLSVGNGNPKAQTYMFQIRVPADDNSTTHFWYTAIVPTESDGVPAKLLEEVPIYDVPFREENGRMIVDYVEGQDIMAWVTQGRIADRTLEHLGATDVGIVKYRRMLQREMKKVADGEDPIGTVRDPAGNAIIELPVEKNKHHFSEKFEQLMRQTQARYSPIIDDIVGLYTKV